MKRLCSLMLALCLLWSATLPALAQGKYPTEWDLTRIFPDVEAWEEAYGRAEASIDALEELRGTLDKPESYLKFLTGDDEMTPTYFALYNYPGLLYTLDASDSQAQDLLARYDQLTIRWTQAVAFFDEEVAALPLEQRKKIFADKSLAPYAYALEAYLEEAFEPLGEEAISALSLYSPALGQIGNIYQTLSTLELPLIPATLSDGTEVGVDYGVYSEITGSDAERADKLAVAEAYFAQYGSFQHTFAALLGGQAQTAWADALLNGYPTVREAAMDTSNLDPALYDLLLASVHEGLPLYHRHLELLRKILGAQEMYHFDMYSFASTFQEDAGNYDAMVDEVREALSVLGEDYIALYDRMVTEGHIDVYPADGKQSGAFSASMSSWSLPYILLNNYGIPGEAGTLAHEMGHALYDAITAEAQIPLYQGSPIFTHEVASTTNELLYYLYKMEHASEDQERLYYLELVLQLYSGAFFTQAMYSEFEDVMYAAVEEGGALSADLLNEAWSGLTAQYYAPLTPIPGIETRWASIPHFMNSSYYVYQYATSLAYASALVHGITSGEEGAVEAYLAFLKAGASDDPVELLKAAGVDPNAWETYDSALAFYGGLIDEFEELTRGMAPAEDGKMEPRQEEIPEDGDNKM